MPPCEFFEVKLVLIIARIIGVEIVEIARIILCIAKTER